MTQDDEKTIDRIANGSGALCEDDAGRTERGGEERSRETMGGSEKEGKKGRKEMKMAFQRFAIVCGVLSLVLIASTSLFAADDGRFLSGGHVNGRGWLATPEIGKLMYVSGAISAFQSVPSKEGNLFIPAHLSNIEICGALDGFYSDAVNLSVPVVWALGIVARRTEGVDPVTVEKLAAEMRKAAIEPATGAEGAK